MSGHIIDLVGIIEFLKAMHAFNLLTSKIVALVSQSFKVNAEEICKFKGITYWTE